jgi:Ala-tRNA(Pro) deacylase
MTTPAIDALFERLRSLGIETETVTHPAVYTVEQAKEHRVRHDGTHVKNLFLRNKKGAMWLVVVDEDRAVDLKDLGRRIGAGNVSFGSPDRLRRYLGVEPGSVTPLAIVNDTEGAVQVVIDARVFHRDPVQCHPLVNTMTTAIRGDDLLRFLQACGHAPTILDLDAPAGA